MKAIRLVLATALGALIFLPVTASNAAVILEGHSAATASPNPLAAAELEGPEISGSSGGNDQSSDSNDSKDSGDSGDSNDSGDSGDSNDGDTSGSGSDSDADNAAGTTDTDKTREELELRYGDPSDVSLAPKLLLPQGLRPPANAKNMALQRLSFDVIQLGHLHGGGILDRHIEPELTALKSQRAQITAVPLNIEFARISFKTPAQEFFDAAWVGIGGMAFSAVALGGIALVRSRRR